MRFGVEGNGQVGKHKVMKDKKIRLMSQAMGIITNLGGEYPQSDKWIRKLLLATERWPD